MKDVVDISYHLDHQQRPSGQAALAADLADMPVDNIDSHLELTR
jgi:hypothetical protein